MADKDECDIKAVQQQLGKLRSMLYHAQIIADELQYVYRTLREHETISMVYTVTDNLEINLLNIQEIFADAEDIRYQDIYIEALSQKALIIYVEGMASQEIINEHILEKLTAADQKHAAIANTAVDIKEKLLTAASVQQTASMDKAVQAILNGETALFVDNLGVALIIVTRDLELRSISEPQTENDLRGPRDSFIEDATTNISLIRRRLKSPNLVVKKYIIGKRSHTDIALLYLKGIANYNLVCDIERRLESINFDSPETIGIQSLVEEDPYSPFPTILTSERPDRCVTALNKGKAVIVIDGTPFCLIAPFVFADAFAAGDDYYEKPVVATPIRLLRYISSFFALTVPGVYIAITSFHPAFLPTPLTLAIGTARERIPFPVFFEALLMIFFLEVMVEAGIRLPKTIGPAVSIVGGLVIGEAAVMAGLVSSPLIIITAFTAIATFSITNYRVAMAFRLLRVILMAFGASFGIFGVAIGLILIAAHLSHIESFGEPYLAPLTPTNTRRLSDLKDSPFMVAPAQAITQRPAYLEPEDLTRQNTKEGEA